MEYYRDEEGKLTKLSQQNVDTGMGFERMCSILQQVPSVYDTDIFQPLLQVINKYFGTDSQTQHQMRKRIIADHARTAYMLINDGLLPSNIGAGYVLRMIIRRMTYNSILLKELSITDYQKCMEELLEASSFLRDFNKKEIIRVIMEEISLFQKTIKNGMQILKGYLEQAKTSQEKIIS